MISTADKNNTTNQQIKRLDINKAVRESNMPTKVVKPFDNLIVVYLQENFSDRLKKGTFLKTLKRLWLIQLIKRTAKRKNQTMNQLPFSLIYLKFMDDFYMIKSILISVIFSLNNNAAFVSDIMPNAVS